MIKSIERPFTASTLFDQDLARIRAHRSNIRRYRGLLRTSLTDLERTFINRRMAEEQSSLDAIAAETFPMSFPDQKLSDRMDSL